MLRSLRSSLALALCVSRVCGVVTDLTGTHLDITTVYDGDGVYVDMFGGDRASGFVDPSEWTGFIIDQIDWVARHTGARRVGRATCAHARARFRSFFARRRLHLHAPLRDGNWL